MSVADFVSELFESGRVRIFSAARPTTEEIAEALPILVQIEADYRRSLPGRPPEFSLPAAEWSLHKFYRAAQFLIDRAANADTVESELAAPYEACIDASTHYSVDVMFQFLPDLARLSRAAATDDPLIKPLLKWAEDWPLSSVGMADVVPRGLSVVTDHPALLRLYVDRIIERGDRARLNCPVVRESVRAALGLHPELANELAHAVEEMNRIGSNGPNETGPNEAETNEAETNETGLT